MHMCISNYGMRLLSSPSKSRAALPRSFLYCEYTYTFLLFTFVLFSSSLLLFSFPMYQIFLTLSIQPLFFVLEIDQATEVSFKDAAKN